MALHAATIVLVISTCAAITLRLLAQRQIERQWAADNIMILIATIFRHLEVEGLPLISMYRPSLSALQ